MSNQHQFFKLSYGLMSLFLILSVTAFAGSDKGKFHLDKGTPELKSSHNAAIPKSAGMVSVIVKLKHAPLLQYDGKIPGLAATRPNVQRGERLDVNAPKSQVYLAYLADQFDKFEKAAKGAIPSARITYRYDVILGAVALLVPKTQMERLKSLPDVVAIYPDDLHQVDTEVSPKFIGAPKLWNQLGGQNNAGEGIIVGVLDTGIWPEHPSYSDPDPLGKPYSTPPPPISGTRACEFTGGSNPGAAFTCNNKLIGADRFMATYDAIIGLLPGEFTTARDDNGHGTHTSSTATGNAGVAASIFGVPRGTVSGIAPRAHVMMYKTCGDQGCFSSDTSAAVQEAILDGVDAVNYSIAGGTNPYADAVELAFLDAYNAGVFVATSAGNSGPAADTVAHRGPWTTTVAASTTSRHFISTLTLKGNGDKLKLEGASITAGISVDTSVVFPPAGEELCGSTIGVNPFPPGTFNGEIVICQRGITGRIEKGFNVFTGGAGGMILYNPVLQGLATDNHFLPTIHLENDAGAAVLDFMATHTGVTGIFTEGKAKKVQGDVLASFSSRGGPGQTLGISKPDITAPGVQILAGTTPSPATIDSGPPGELFQAIQGTSMSSPHTAGAAALIKDLHPNWTPGQIRSSLMTTAKTKKLFKEDGSTPFDPFDAGSGRIDLRKAGDPGVTIDETGANFITLQNTLWNANYPSVYIPTIPGQITVPRTIHDVTGSTNQWKLKDKGTPSDVEVIVPNQINVPANGDATFDINIDARNVPLGEVRHGTIRLKDGNHRLNIPWTIVRGQPIVALDKSCNPAQFPKNSTTTCTINITNNSFSDANVNLIDNLPSQLTLIPGSVVGATPSNNGVVFNGVVGAAAPPDPSLAPGPSPAGGYLPLSDFGIPPVSGVGDDTIINFNVPPFVYAGEVYSVIGFSSNGYAVIGGGSGPDNTIINQNFPDPTVPNNVLAPFWTDLNPPAGGALRIGTLTDGIDTWIVLDWEAVVEFSSPLANSFQMWIGINSDTNPGEDISFAFGTINGNGDNGLMSTGVENRFGNRGNNVYFNGTGTLPSNGTELRVTSAPPAPGETHTITFDATGTQKGDWQNCAEMTSDLFQGVNIACFNGEVQ